jgi:hypothetical protein
MFDNCLFMIHNPLMICAGNASELRQQAEWLDRVGGIMAGIYMARCTKTEAELQAALDAETYLTAAEARDWGFVTDVVVARQAAAVADLGTLEALGLRVPAATGRTLSGANETKLRDAKDLIGEVLNTLDGKAEDPDVTASGDAAATMRPVDRAGLASLLTASRRH